MDDGGFHSTCGPTLRGICCEFQVKINPRAFIYNPALAINLGWHIGTKINIIHSTWVCVLSVQLMHVCDAPNVSLNDSSLSFGADMDHRRSLLPCCCSPSDNSVQLDHRSCSRSQLASGGVTNMTITQSTRRRCSFLIKESIRGRRKWAHGTGTFLIPERAGGGWARSVLRGKIRPSRGPSAWLQQPPPTNTERKH